jgi:hypothetical protein
MEVTSILALNPYFPDKDGCKERNLYNRKRDSQRRI